MDLIKVLYYGTENTFLIYWSHQFAIQTKKGPPVCRPDRMNSSFFTLMFSDNLIKSKIMVDVGNLNKLQIVYLESSYIAPKIPEKPRQFPYLAMVILPLHFATELITFWHWSIHKSFQKWKVAEEANKKRKKTSVISAFLSFRAHTSILEQL